MPPAVGPAPAKDPPQGVSSAPIPPTTAVPESTPPQDTAFREGRAAELHEFRKWLLGISYENAASFDKTLTTLSAGALALSVSWGAGKNVWVWGLKLSWAFFTASLLAQLFSFRTAGRELQRHIAHVDEMLAGTGIGRKKVSQAMRYEVTTYLLNNAALVCMIAGVCCLITFAAMNV